jgi:hypothetical protein
MPVETDNMDSRLVGHFTRRDDVQGTGMQQLYCLNCGRRAGAVRFDDPDRGQIAVVCDPCIEKLGQPPLVACTRLNSKEQST